MLSEIRRVHKSIKNSEMLIVFELRLENSNKYTLMKKADVLSAHAASMKKVCLWYFQHNSNSTSPFWLSFLLIKQTVLSSADRCSFRSGDKQINMQA